MGCPSEWICSWREGVAAVVLKTLSATEANNDNIECVIRESGTNQDGRTKGITLPEVVAQDQLIRDRYARAGLDTTKAADPSSPQLSSPLEAG